MTESILPNLLKGFNENILNIIKLGRLTAHHPTERGDAAEKAWLDLLRTYLPERYKVSKGFVVDSNGRKSEQIDLIIFDRQYTPFIFKLSDLEYIPAEGVYAALEVKQSLNSEHISYAQKKIASVRALHRTSLPVPNIHGTSKPKEPPYIHGGLLCYHSELSPPFGQTFEKAIADYKADSRLNLVCVADLGIFEIDEGSQSVKMTNYAAALFFFRILSVLQKKATVPMIDPMAYARWLS